MRLETLTIVMRRHFIQNLFKLGSFRHTGLHDQDICCQQIRGQHDVRHNAQYHGESKSEKLEVEAHLKRLCTQKHNEQLRGVHDSSGLVQNCFRKAIRKVIPVC